MNAPLPALKTLGETSAMTRSAPRPPAHTAVPLENATLAGNELIQTPIGEIALADSYFSDADSQRLFDEMDYQRAVQSYLWCHPLVSMATWRDRQKAAFSATALHIFGIAPAVLRF